MVSTVGVPQSPREARDIDCSPPPLGGEFIWPLPAPPNPEGIEALSPGLRCALRKVVACILLTLALVHPSFADDLPGLSYTNSRIESVPWSIHVVRLDRADPSCQIQSLHAEGEAIGLETLSEQLARVSPSAGRVVAAINGDFYQRDKTFAGAPRGLQVVNGELISGPTGGACFWIDALGEPHTAQVKSKFQITWPDGDASPFGINGDRRPDGVELYSRMVGTSTHTDGGCELILDGITGSPWPPLRIGRTYKARVREIREQGDSALSSDTLVLSLGPKFPRPHIKSGDVLLLSTASEPGLHGIRTAIGGGPVLVDDGSRMPLNLPDSLSYEVTSMVERHPRTALGWNERYFFLVEVDGRQKHLSAGMTLEELARFFTKLGCTEAMNFDGGGSATLWFDGEVRNSPCDRAEREIANCLAIVKKKQ